MKIGVVTFWDSNDNYGQILQYYALQTYLQSIGHSPFLIRYLPSQQSAYKQKKSFIKQFSKIFKSEYIKYFIRKAYNRLYHPFVNRYILNHNQDRGFSDFKKKYLISSKIYSATELKANPPIADAYICGSDQIWSGAGNDDIYFLNFGTPDTRRISISASFGREYKSLGEEEKQRLIPLLQKFGHITIREQAGVDICHKLGREDAALICDPTILNDPKVYQQSLKLSYQPNDDIFIYYLGHKTTISDRKIVSYFKSQKADVRYVAAQGIVNQIPKIFPRIEDWLAEIYNAKFVVTNSFHGTVFSILFKKDFATTALQSDNANTRIYTLLQKFGLENRICKSISDLEVAYKTKIDYSVISPIVENFRMDGQKLISEILN